MAAATPDLDIRLFGGLRIRAGSTPLPPLESARTESLLAYLLLYRDVPQSRQRIAFVFWPDSSEAQARTNLRHVLHNLRRELPDADRYVEVTRRTVGWRADAPFRLDVAEFDRALQSSPARGISDDIGALRRGVDLYVGDLLEGVYDEWITEHRDRLRRRYSEALATLVQLLERRGEHARALPYAERLLRLDPLREESYRHLMKVHAACGDRARALRVYHECSAYLDRELGVEPSPATRELYESLLPENPATTVEAAAARSRDSGLVGRDAEWARLFGYWRESRDGRARLVLVGGEAGVGKTRLVEELRDLCMRQGVATAEARAYAAEGELGYAPLLAWLRSEPVASQLERLEPRHHSELARLLPELSASTDVGSVVSASGADRRLRLFQALAAAFTRARAPLLLVADDLQWWDHDSLHFVHYLLRSHRAVPLMIAATARVEEISEAGSAVTELMRALRALELAAEIGLGPLSRADAALLAERSAGVRMSKPASDRLFEETEGNPLFVVEAVRGGWPAEGSASVDTPKVRAVLDRRVDALSRAGRELGAVAATIGREFTSDLLAEASGAPEASIVHALDELWRRRIIRERGAESYDFSHDKLREAFGRTLSPTRRRQIHLRVARALERLHAGDPSPRSAQIASHFDHAGAVGEALRWYPLAAGEAIRVHAHGEATRLLERALSLLATTPASRERDETELPLLLALLTPLSTVEGHSSARLADVQRRAAELAAVSGAATAPELLRSMALTNLSRGRFDEARGVGQQLHARGEREGDESVLVESHYVLGISAFWQGQHEAARRHFEAAVQRYRPEQRDTHLVRYGLDPQVICVSRLANTLWFLGLPSAALRTLEEARLLAEAGGHPPSHSIQLVFAGLLALELQDAAGLRTWVEALRRWCGDHEYRAIAVTLQAMQGYVDVLEGCAADGLAQIRGALIASEDAEHAPGLYATMQRLLLAACEAAGDAEAGLAAAGLPPGSGQGTRLWAAETLRQRARFGAALGAASQDVEADLEQALDVARRQGARSLEVRVAATLLRHRLARGRRAKVEEARARLSAALDRLPEPNDTTELREARALLDV